MILNISGAAGVSMLYLFTFMMVRAMRGAAFNSDSEEQLSSIPRAIAAAPIGMHFASHLSSTNSNAQPVPVNIEAVLVATGRVVSVSHSIEDTVPVSGFATRMDTHGSGHASFVGAITLKALPLSDIANWRGMPEWVRLLYIGFTISSFLVAILSAILFHFVSHNFSAVNLLFLASSNIVCIVIVLRCTFAILTAISSVRGLQTHRALDKSACQSCFERIRELDGFKLLVIVVVGLDSFIVVTQLYYGYASIVAPRNSSTTILTDTI